MVTSIRAAVVDDEPLGRMRIRTLLDKEADFEIVGEYRDAARASHGIAATRPDVLFLDVQMPRGSAFSILDSLPDRRKCATVLITAHDQYALRAFDYNVIDYLLKPFDADRFRKSLDQVRLHMRELMPKSYPSRLSVKSKEGCAHVLRIDDIDWIETAGNYVRIHVGRESFLHRQTMMSLEAAIDPSRFVRIHRSTLVNVDRIKKLQPAFRREFVVTLGDGTQLTLSAPYRDRLASLIGRF